MLKPPNFGERRYKGEENDKSKARAKKIAKGSTWESQTLNPSHFSSHPMFIQHAPVTQLVTFQEQPSQPIQQAAILCKHKN
jgi:hypothetical protein